MSYKVKLQSFEGPFDLLVYLIENAEMSIYDIEISKITGQYLEYIRAMEEMDINVTINESDYLLTIEHVYPDFAITMHTYLCKIEKPDFVMKEHISFKWLTVNELDTLDWAEADKPIVEFLKGRCYL